MAASDKVARRKQELVDFMSPHLEPGESVEAIVALASGPLPPYFPIIPVVGVIALFTPRYRAYGVVATNRRVLLVRRRKLGPPTPFTVDRAETLGRVRVVEWSMRSGYGKLVLAFGDPRIRLNVLSKFVTDVKRFVEVVRSGEGKA